MSSGLDHARLALLVHEVRSPVAALAAVAETVGEPPTDGSARRELVRLALAACRGIERVVMDLAVASVKAEPLDVAVLVREAVAAHVLRGASIAVEADGPLVVEADPVRLRQALDNLVANALAYGGGEGVKVRATASDRGVRIAVSDAGPGIPPDDVERIFELGVRLGGEKPGSGLGLALARAIVEAHGGFLDVDSALGTGSTFTIVLPMGLDQPAT